MALPDPYANDFDAARRNFDNLDQRYPLQLGDLANAIRHALNPTGTILATARAAAPDGYLLCDGSAISRTDYEVFSTPSARPTE